MRKLSTHYSSLWLIPAASIQQEQFHIFQENGSQNLANNIIEHHPAQHHGLMRPIYLLVCIGKACSFIFQQSVFFIYLVIGRNLGTTTGYVLILLTALSCITPLNALSRGIWCRFKNLWWKLWPQKKAPGRIKTDIGQG